MVANGRGVNRLPPRRAGLSVSTLAVIYGLTLLVIALPPLVSASADVPVAVLVRDPATTLGGHPLTGLQSHIGVLIWWGGASVCLFTAVVLWRMEGYTQARSFLLWSGIVTAVLAGDDLFLFHEELAPRYLNLDERFVFAAYGLAIACYLVAFRSIILKSEYWLLLVALLLFASSIVVDEIVEHKWLSPWRIVVEDGLKLLGIVSWTAFLSGESARALAVRPRAATDATMGSQ
jgi:hypothetical protein